MPALRATSLQTVRHRNSYEISRAAALDGADARTVTWLGLVEAADGQPLEPLVIKAVDNLIKGLKSDTAGGLADFYTLCVCGARTLAGSLIPITGATPNPFNLVAGDYNRKIGWKGDGSTKYIDSGVSGAISPNSFSVSGYTTEFVADSTARSIIANGNTQAGTTCLLVVSNVDGVFVQQRCQNGAVTDTRTIQLTGGLPQIERLGYFGVRRTSPASYISRLGKSEQPFATVSETARTQNFHVLARNPAAGYFAGRIAAWHVGTANIIQSPLEDRLNQYFAELSAVTFTP